MAARTDEYELTAFRIRTPTRADWGQLKNSVSSHRTCFNEPFRVRVDRRVAKIGPGQSHIQ